MKKDVRMTDEDLDRRIEEIISECLRRRREALGFPLGA